jgi:hypothetical protein
MDDKITLRELADNVRDIDRPECQKARHERFDTNTIESVSALLVRLADMGIDTPEELEAFAAAGQKLPRTADGVPITHGMTLYEKTPSGRLNLEVATIAIDDKYEPLRWSDDMSSCYYSSRHAADEAADAAREGEKEGA